MTTAPSHATITFQCHFLVPLCLRTDSPTCYLRCVSSDLLWIFFLLVAVGGSYSPQASFQLMTDLTDGNVHWSVAQWPCPPFIKELKTICAAHSQLSGPSQLSAVPKLDPDNHISRPPHLQATVQGTSGWPSGLCQLYRALPCLMGRAGQPVSEVVSDDLKKG